jgi:hypothetical protein
MRAHRKLQRRRQGLQVIGPGFYLWDPDAREALSLAAELSRRRLPTRARSPRETGREPD